MTKDDHQRCLRHRSTLPLRAMWLSLIILFPLVANAQIAPSNPLDEPGPGRPYTLPVSVNEVNLTFSALDRDGLPINDLQLSDLELLDNNKKPARILSFQHRTNRQIRAGILIDSSYSMRWSLRRNILIASDFSTHVLRQNSDQAFVMRFDFDQLIKPDWTSISDDLIHGVSTAVNSFNSRIGGTAVFDSIYIACRDKFGSAPPSPTGTGNFIMLFTDGIDNQSHTRVEDVIDICQKTHVAIYAFSNEPASSHDPGQLILKDLSEKSGGRIFYNQPNHDPLSDLRTIEQHLRSDYILTYKPAKLKPDGSFHRIRLSTPYKVAAINTRSGYYAPHQPH